MNGDRNMEQKLKILGKAALKFKGTAYRLVDAANALAKYEGGSRGHKKAQERYQKCDAAFVEADQALDVLIDEFC